MKGGASRNTLCIGGGLKFGEINFHMSSGTRCETVLLRLHRKDDVTFV